jgi:ribosomal protein L40E
MLAVHCLSCEHDNPAGAKFCAACGSTLNLKLCKQCEAINDGGAQRCHHCGTQFPAQSAAPAQSPAKQSGVAVAAGAPDLRVIESASSLVAGPLSTRQALRAERAGPPRKLLSALLLAVIAASAYHLYRQSAVGPNAIAAGVADAAVVEPATSALSVRAAQSSVTHTNRVATGPIAARPDTKPTAAVAAGASDVSTPALATSALPEASYQPVTHTKRVDAASVAASAAPRVKLHPDQQSHCTAAVAALGFCIPSANAEGN